MLIPQCLQRIVLVVVGFGFWWSVMGENLSTFPTLLGGDLRGKFSLVPGDSIRNIGSAGVWKNFPTNLFRIYRPPIHRLS